MNILLCLNERLKKKKKRLTPYFVPGGNKNKQFLAGDTAVKVSDRQHVGTSIEGSDGLSLQVSTVLQDTMGASFWFLPVELRRKLQQDFYPLNILEYCISSKYYSCKILSYFKVNKYIFHSSLSDQTGNSEWLSFWTGCQNAWTESRTEDEIS